MSIPLFEKKILKLWHDDTWKGSYTGIKTFQSLLKTDKNINVSERQLYEILKKDPLYLKHLKPKRKIDRRSYDLNYYGELLQADLAYMFKDENYQYFIVLIDCYSLKTFCEPLKSKTSDEVLKAFIKLLKLFKTDVTKLEVDQGTEFNKVRQYCLKNKILFKLKFGTNKASFAEWIIKIIKWRLYKLLRDKITTNWTKYINRICVQFNETPQKKIGYLKPNDITSIYDSAKIRDALNKHNISENKVVDFKNQIQNQINYTNSMKNLQKDDYVYLTFKEDIFGKSFDIQVKSYIATF